MKKLISTVLAAALTLSLAACGSTAASSTSEAASGNEAASTASSETASDASDAVDFTGDGYDATVDYASLAGTTIKVAASPRAACRDSESGWRYLGKGRYHPGCG